MGYLVDTNVLSELIKNKPNESVIKWFDSIPSKELYITVITIGEIKKGITKLRDESRKKKIQKWLDHDLLEWFSERIINVDIAIANKWGLIQGQSIRTLPAIDSLIAAIAMHHDLVIVTRNTKDFEYPGIEVINPFI